MVEKRNVTVDIRREVANVFVRIVEETIRTPLFGWKLVKF